MRPRNEERWKRRKTAISMQTRRSANYHVQIGGSLVFKALAVAAAFFAVPLMIRYLGQDLYGVWATLLTIMSWVVFFDLGISNGLRNMLAEALAKSRIRDSRKYISSAYSMIGMVSLGLLVVITIGGLWVPWQSVFNIHTVEESVLRNAVWLAGVFILLNFWLSLIGAVLNAVQKTSFNVLGQFISNILALLLVYGLTKTNSVSLVWMAAVYGTSLVAGKAVLTIWYFRNNRRLQPELRLDRGHVRPLLSLGIRFFVIQVAALVVFTTDRVLITQLFGPAHVTQYDVVFKLFSVVILMHSLITDPLWSAYTDAFHRGDLAWIRMTMGNQIRIYTGLVVILVLMILLARPVIGWWIGGGYEVPNSLVFSMAAFVAIMTWNNVFAYCVNGIGAITPQFYLSIYAMTIKIPLSIFLAVRVGWGMNGILIASCIGLLPFAVVGPLQVRRILDRSRFWEKF